jgi:hypothetical protein
LPLGNPMPLDRFRILFTNVSRVVFPIEADRGITLLLVLIQCCVSRSRYVHVALVIEAADARDQVRVKTHKAPEVKVTAARYSCKRNILQ